MSPFAALPLLALAGCSVCQPTRFTWPVFDDPIAALIAADDGGQSSTPASVTSEPAASSDVPSAPVAEQPSAPAAETPSAPVAEQPSSPAAETPSAPSQPPAEAPATQTPSAPSTSDGVGGQQETREESHDRG